MLRSNPTIGDVIENLGAESPGAPAVQARGATAASYQFLVAQIADTRRFLSERGFDPGARIAIILSDPARAMTVYLGVMNSAVAVPMSPKLSEFELEILFRELNLSAVLFSEDLAHVAEIAARASLPTIWAAPGGAGVAGDYQLWGGGSRKSARVRNVRHDDTACVMTSSGTTGRAKATLQSHEMLVFRSERDRHILNLSQADTTINFRPPHLSGPLNIGLLGAVCSGGSVVVPTNFDADKFFEDLLKFGITWYTGGPAYHRAILENASLHPEALENHKLRFVRSAGYSLPQDIQEELETTFGVPCVQKYGSSEAGLVSCNPLPPGARKVGTCGPIIDCEVRIVSDEGNDLGSSEVGEIWVRGPGVFTRYDDDSLTRASFSGDWFKTGDLGTVDADGYLSIAGRKNEIINRGGQKIAPQEVEKVYAALPGVAEVLCFPIPHKTLGATAGLAVVARENATLIPEELRTLASGKLSRFKQPETIMVTDRLPRGPTGKPLRTQTAEFLGLDRDLDEVENSGHSPADELAQIWCDTLRIDLVHEDHNFTRMGGDSLRGMQLVLKIEKSFGVSLPIEIIYEEGATLRGLRAAIKKLDKTDEKRRQLPRRKDPKADLPLSSSQKRLWSICRTFPDVTLYNSSFGLRFPGPFDQNAMRKALNLMVARHEILRAVFPDTGGRPLQRILPQLMAPFEITDLTKELSDDFDGFVRDTAHQIARRPFDLAEGPLVRFDVLLVRDGAVLLQQMHHIIGDAISTSVLAREITVAYAAFKNGAIPALPKIERTFGDFVEDQDNRLSEYQKAELVNFWLQELEGVETSFSLPTDRPRPPAPSHKGERIFFRFGEAASRGLRKVAAQKEATLFATALAAFEVLVHRLTGKETFIVGTGIDTRPPEFRDQIVGFCLNTLPIPARIRADQRFSELLREVQKGLRRAQAHAEAPFQDIVNGMASDRRGSDPPLVQVLFGHMPRGTRPSDISNTEASLWNLDHQGARFDLTIMLDETDGGLGGFAEFSSDIYDRDAIQRLIDQYRMAIAAIATDPDKAVSEYPILPDKERQLIEGFSKGPMAEYPSDTGIAGVFADVAKATPEATVIIHGKQRVTYRALDRWSDGIARELISQGVGLGDIVGLSAERTPAAIAGLLGILKVGGAYLALEPELPAQRIADMLGDAGVKLTLLQKGSSLQLNGFGDILDLAKYDQDSVPPAPFKSRRGRARDLAYVCYTSGTTGLPKGIEVEQRSVLRLVLGADYAVLGADVRICQSGAFGFDASTFEIWGALLNGGTLVQPEAAKPTLSELADLIDGEGINTLWLTAGLFRQIVDHRPDCFRNIGQVLTGGDVVSADHVQKLNGASPSCRVINCYGPTENTTFSICGELDQATLETGKVPIGRPIANSSAYILDSDRCILPIGVEGDLYVGGEGVARGYRGKPDLTQSVFSCDPYSTEENARMYRTGDRARFLADGRIEFLGRKDFQIKIRGFRVELEEVETVLRTHDQVKDAVVLAKSDSGDLKTLHAFAISVDGKPHDETRLRAHLAARLPGYMIPATFAALDCFPLNASGKIDRGSLLDLCEVRSVRADQTQKIPPQSRTEQLLGEIWAEILPEAGHIGRDDSFFAIGGDSLLVMRLGFRIEEETGLKLSQINLFSNSTLGEMATWIENAILTTEVATQVFNIWREVTGTQARSPTTSFFDQRGDESLLAQLLRYVSGKFNVNLSMVDVFWDPSILGISRLVLRDLHRHQVPLRSEVSKYQPVMSLVDGTTKVPIDRIQGRDSFFVVSGAGGHVLPFAPVARRLMTSWHGVGLLDPGFDPSAPRFTNITDVAALIENNAHLADPEGPYLLVGYSYGGHVAFEAARRLQARGALAGLVIIDSQCRSTRGNIIKMVKRGKSWLRGLIKSVVLLDAAVPQSLEDVRYDDISRQERAARKEMSSSQSAILRYYVPRHSDIPLVLIRGRSSKNGGPKDRGWSRAAHVIGVLETTGNHLTLFKGENEKAFVVALDKALSMLRSELTDQNGDADR